LVAGILSVWYAAVFFTAGTRRRRDMVQLLLPAAGSSTKKSIWHLQDGQNVIQPAFPCPVFQVSLGDLK